MKNYRAVVLGAGKPLHGYVPPAIALIRNNQRVLDWLLKTFSTVTQQVTFVGGYHIEDIVRTYPHLNYVINPDWSSTKATSSLLCAKLDNDFSYFVSYADVLFRPACVEQMASLACDIVVAVDSDWKNRYAQRSQQDINQAEVVELNADQIVTFHAADSHPNQENTAAEFIGLMKFSPRAIQAICELKQTHPHCLTWTLPTLMNHLSQYGLTHDYIDVKGDWCELNTPQDLAHFILGTKAETLDRLKPMLATGIIGEQVTVDLHSWQENPTLWLKKIAERFPDTMVIVRSSALHEDGFQQSQAGKFLSIPNVNTDDIATVQQAINAVFDSYQDTRFDHQVLIQAMLTDIAISGVVLTRTLNYGAPYYVINYDDTSSSTDSVTSGANTPLKTLVLHHSQTTIPDHAHPFLKHLLPVLQELIACINHDSIDVEFIINNSGDVHILQLRPITVDHSNWMGTDELINQALLKAAEKYRTLQQDHPFLHGKKAIFGIMPDWNPAEIIGKKPRLLAYSLYHYLITEAIWAKQRYQYGYRRVQPHALMVSFAGQPYIDIRASFNSFIPAALSEQLANKLVNYYLSCIEEHPEFHDKVEFNILFTCMMFDFHQKATQRLTASGFNAAEIEELAAALTTITDTAFTRSQQDLADIELLAQRYEQIQKSDLSLLDKAFVLLNDCKDYGTLPFAHLARSAFIAVALLDSAVTTQLITEEEKLLLLNSIHTVAKQYSADCHKLRSKQISTTLFLEKYGHLRPGTYDILVPSIFEDFDRYCHFKEQQENTATDDKADAFHWTEEKKDKFSTALKVVGLPNDVQQFSDFLTTAIEGREYAKFIFTRNLSTAMQYLIEYAELNNIDRETLSHLSLEHFQLLQHDAITGDVKQWLQQCGEEGKLRYEISLGVELPPIISSEADFFGYVYPDNVPNYITQGSISAPLVCLENATSPNNTLTNKIVIIPQADPGYDWLFSHNIAGLITAYGGVNSHMAIRCAEFGLPAVIGVGEKLYQHLSTAQLIKLDCQAQTVEIIQ